MKSLPPRSVVGVQRLRAFTLIELLAVMAIILVLAGLIINVAGSAQYNSAKSRATAEINAMSVALGNYQTDNGVYPTDPNDVNGSSLPTTQVLDPQDTTNYGDPAKYLNSSEFLYQALAGYQVSGGNATISKKYLDFKPSQLHVAANAGSVTVPTSTSAFMYLIDPFGFSYGYSTIYATTLAAQNAAGTSGTTSIKTGYNPTFDLWSTAGYAAGGKSTPSTLPANVSSPSAYYNSIWVKNW